MPQLPFGFQPSAVRAWIQPTQMTESLVHKDFFTHTIKQGFQVDTHTPTGAPKEGLVRVTKSRRRRPRPAGASHPATRTKR
jgi:hypothetical protein